MNFTTLFIKKPVLSIVVSLLLLLVGLVSYFKLPIRQYPMISVSVVNISTNYPGSSAKTIESYVTSPIEQALSGLDGVDYITSSSVMGNSTVTIHFKLGIDINQAISDARDKVSSIRYKLPKDAFDPVVVKAAPNADPLIYISLTSDHLSPEQVTDYIKRVIQPSLQNIDGVAQAQILGERQYTMRLRLNPAQMAAHNVTVTEIIHAITSNQTSPPAGRLISKAEEYDVTAQTDVNTADDFNNLVISTHDGYLSRLKDVTTTELAPSEARSSVLVNGHPGVMIGIIGRSDSNPIMISDGITHALQRLSPQLPEDLNVTVVWDNSKFIQSSIHEVKRTIIEASLCVILVMFLFLGSIRLLSVPFITIPLSLIGVFSLMLAMGFSINTLTLLAIVLAIGLVVDDAIVVAENIHRHIEEGLTPMKAAIRGAREIQFAVISMTITLAAVFTPIGFLNGLTGSLFKEFAFTLAATVILSGLIALILSPMMCSKIMTPHATEGRLPTKINRVFVTLNTSYEWLLKNVLRWRVIIPIFLILSILADYYLYLSLHQELAPKEDAGAAISIATAPPNANLDYTEYYTKQMADISSKVPEKEHVCVINGMMGVNSALSFITLKPWDQRSRSTDQIAAQLNGEYWAIPGISAFALNPFSLPGSSGFMPVGFVLQTTGDYEKLYSATHNMIDKMRESGLFMNVNTSLKVDSPEIQMKINRDLAGDLGIPISDIAQTVHLSLGAPEVAKFSMDGRSYSVVPDLMSEFKSTPSNLYNLSVRSQHGDLVPLANLVTLTEVTKSKSLAHFNQLRSTEITAGLAPGKSMGEAIAFLKNSARNISDKNVQYDFTNESRQFLSTGKEVLFTFVFALVFIMLLLCAQFESFIAPFIVLSGLFFSVTGALSALKLWGYSSNIYTQIGIVTLIGLISKHGILIIEFTNQLIAEGASPHHAIVKASCTRLRPILMTTAAMVLGALPLVFATGAGALSRQEIGLVIVSGMSIGTLMTLFVVPAVYLIVQDIKGMRRLLRSRGQSKAAKEFKMKGQ